jgi:hypothetical protein
MRVYVRTWTETAARLLEQGRWEDLYNDYDEVGVECQDPPLLGALGDAMLYTDVPESVFRDAIWDEQDKQDIFIPVIAIIPAEVLNQYGPPRLWDHDHTREELLDAAARWEQVSPDGQERAKALRNLVAFFDRDGWLPCP